MRQPPAGRQYPGARDVAPMTVERVHATRYEAGEERAMSATSSEDVRAGRPEAAAVIWRWKDPPDDARARAARARRTGALRALVALIAAGVFVYLDRTVAAAIASTLGVLTLALALLSPLGLYAALDRAVAALGRGVGLVLTWLLLAPVYYLFFAPFGLLFRRGRRDPLRRGFEADARSYWLKRDRARPLDRPY